MSTNKRPPSSLQPRTTNTNAAHSGHPRVPRSSYQQVANYPNNSSDNWFLQYPSSWLPEPAHIPALSSSHGNIQGQFRPSYSLNRPSPEMQEFIRSRQSAWTIPSSSFSSATPSSGRHHSSTSRSQLTPIVPAATGLQPVRPLAPPSSNLGLRANSLTTPPATVNVGNSQPRSIPKIEFCANISTTSSATSRSSLAHPLPNLDPRLKIPTAPSNAASSVKVKNPVASTVSNTGPHTITISTPFKSSSATFSNPLPTSPPPLAPPPPSLTLSNLDSAGNFRCSVSSRNSMNSNNKINNNNGASGIVVNKKGRIEKEEINSQHNSELKMVEVIFLTSDADDDDDDDDDDDAEVIFDKEVIYDLSKPIKQPKSSIRPAKNQPSQQGVAILASTAVPLPSTFPTSPKIIVPPLNAFTPEILLKNFKETSTSKKSLPDGNLSNTPTRGSNNNSNNSIKVVSTMTSTSTTTSKSTVSPNAAVKIKIAQPTDSAAQVGAKCTCAVPPQTPVSSMNSTVVIPPLPPPYPHPPPPPTPITPAFQTVQQLSQTSLTANSSSVQSIQPRNSPSNTTTEFQNGHQQSPVNDSFVKDNTHYSHRQSVPPVLEQHTQSANGLSKTGHTTSHNFCRESSSFTVQLNRGIGNTPTISQKRIVFRSLPTSSLAKSPFKASAQSTSTANVYISLKKQQSPAKDQSFGRPPLQNEERGPKNSSSFNGRESSSLQSTVVATVSSSSTGLLRCTSMGSTRSNDPNSRPVLQRPVLDQRANVANRNSRSSTSNSSSFSSSSFFSSSYSSSWSSVSSAYGTSTATITTSAKNKNSNFSRLSSTNDNDTEKQRSASFSTSSSVGSGSKTAAQSQLPPSSKQGSSSSSSSAAAAAGGSSSKSHRLSRAVPISGDITTTVIKSRLVNAQNITSPFPSSSSSSSTAARGDHLQTTNSTPSKGQPPSTSKRPRLDNPQPLTSGVGNSSNQQNHHHNQQQILQFQSQAINFSLNTNPSNHLATFEQSEGISNSSKTENLPRGCMINEQGEVVRRIRRHSAYYEKFDLNFDEASGISRHRPAAKHTLDCDDEFEDDSDDSTTNDSPPAGNKEGHFHISSTKPQPAKRRKKLKSLGAKRRVASNELTESSSKPLPTKPLQRSKFSHRCQCPSEKPKPQKSLKIKSSSLYLEDLNAGQCPRCMDTSEMEEGCRCLNDGSKEAIELVMAKNERIIRNYKEAKSKAQSGNDVPLEVPPLLHALNFNQNWYFPCFHCNRFLKQYTEEAFRPSSQSPLPPSSRSSPKQSGSRKEKRRLPLKTQLRRGRYLRHRPRRFTYAHRRFAKALDKMAEDWLTTKHKDAMKIIAEHDGTAKSELEDNSDFHDCFCWECHKPIKGEAVTCGSCHLSWHQRCSSKWARTSVPVRPPGREQSPSRTARYKDHLFLAPIDEMDNICAECQMLSYGYQHDCVFGHLSPGYQVLAQQKVFDYALTIFALKNFLNPHDSRHCFYHVDLTDDNEPSATGVSVEQKLCCRRRKKIYRPMDLETMFHRCVYNKRLPRKFYGTTKQLLFDIKQMIHNIKVSYPGDLQWMHRINQMEPIFENEVKYIDRCDSCYLRHYDVPDESYFNLPCQTPHALVWARHQGAWWPAKAFEYTVPGTFAPDYDRFVVMRFGNLNLNEPLEVSKEHLRTYSKQVPPPPAVEPPESSEQVNETNSGHCENLNLSIEAVKSYISSLKHYFVYRPFPEKSSSFNYLRLYDHIYLTLSDLAVKAQELANAPDEEVTMAAAETFKEEDSDDGEQKLPGKF